MSKNSELWKEIDDAVVAGFVYHMEEISEMFGNPISRHYGTKIWFSGRVSSDQCQKIAHHIRKKYKIRVDYPTAYCLIIWHHDLI